MRSKGGQIRVEGHIGSKPSGMTCTRSRGIPAAR
jgi:hypothetical protein